MELLLIRDMKYLHDNDDTSIVSYSTLNIILSDLVILKKNSNTFERITDKQTDEKVDKLRLGDKRYSRDKKVYFY